MPKRHSVMVLGLYMAIFPLLFNYGSIVQGENYLHIQVIYNLFIVFCGKTHLFHTTGILNAKVAESHETKDHYYLARLTNEGAKQSIWNSSIEDD